MSLNSICNACRDGRHKDHGRSIQAPPEGGVGGVVCVCEGECKDGRYQLTYEQLLGIRRPFT